MSSSLHPDGRANPSRHVSNPSDNDNNDIHAVIASRRAFLRTTLAASSGAVTAALVGTGTLEALAHDGAPSEQRRGHGPRIGFTSVPPNLYRLPSDDAVTVPAGYTARALVNWGDPLTGEAGYDPAQPLDEATQLHTYGAHTDGMHYFPFPGLLGNSRGLLVTNSEYVDPALAIGVAPASAYAQTPLTLAMVRAMQAAHGVNIVTIGRSHGHADDANGHAGRRGSGKGRATWNVVTRSPWNRRITGNTPCDLSGPAAGHPLMRTADDPAGLTVLGTLNNCANGVTPWGTYLTCEENWNGYFSNETGDAAGIADPAQKAAILKDQRRYGVTRGGFGYRWHEVDARFRADLAPHEPNRFGWVVEIDPWDKHSTPVKRTALGRFKHESAMLVTDRAGTVAVYMGDDERNEYVYKFVCARKLDRRHPHRNRDLLDSGTLYVARFDADGTGQWLPLVWGQGGLTPENGFADQGEVLIRARQAADRLGATMMDRPEWIAADPVSGQIYLTLTNNNRRGNTPVSSNAADGSTGAASANPPVDAANPRPDNDYGHILRWKDDGDLAATTLRWDIFAQCGDKATTKSLGSSYTRTDLGGNAGYRGNIAGDDYGAPDGLWFDRDGRLWIQTDQAGDARGDWVNIGGNVMMCANPVTGETRRFLTAPKNCEVTGVAATPDGRTLFVGIQHPGEDWVATFTDNSTWPDSGVNGATRLSGRPVVKPRSGVVAITRDDGGVVGT